MVREVGQTADLQETQHFVVFVEHRDGPVCGVLAIDEIVVTTPYERTVVNHTRLGVLWRRQDGEVEPAIVSGCGVIAEALVTCKCRQL